MAVGSSSAPEQQTSARGPAQPSYVFRGHTAQIHSAHITRRNTCLVTGDADGWVVIWKLETKRPLAVWKAHDGAILGTAEWGRAKFISHGRDHTLRIWQLDTANTSTFSTVLPADGTITDRPKPWLLHSLPVNTLNFCAFSMCSEERAVARDAASTLGLERGSKSSDPILIAVPARDDKKVEVYQFPEEKLVYVVSRVELKDTGMVMAVKLVHHRPSNNILVAVGYEAGLIAVHLLPRVYTTGPQVTRSPIQHAQIMYLSQPHTQPVLSLDALPDGTTFFTSSADAVIAEHRISDMQSFSGSEGTQYSSNTSRAGDPEEVSAQLDQTLHPLPASNAEPDPLPPPLSDPDLHQSEAATGASTGSVEPLVFSKKVAASGSSTTTSSTATSEPGGLSSLLSNAPSKTIVPNPPPSMPRITAAQESYRITNTKHAGQQSLCVRADGRLLVTGGWDSRVRLYSTKTLKEMAVLKWHKEGVYAVAFGDILSADDVAEFKGEDDGEGKQVARRETGLGRLQRQREEQMQVRHWVVAGAKDGRISLWEVF